MRRQSHFEATATRVDDGPAHPRKDARARRKRHTKTSTGDEVKTDPETDVASGEADAAMCVQDINVQCVLQFTLIHAASCALHRRTSRVIHHLELMRVTGRRTTAHGGSP